MANQTTIQPNPSWFWRVDQESQQGPTNLQGILSRIASGEITAQTQVKCDEGTWALAMSYPELKFDCFVLELGDTPNVLGPFPRDIISHPNVISGVPKEGIVFVREGIVSDVIKGLTTGATGTALIERVTAAEKALQARDAACRRAEAALAAKDLEFDAERQKLMSELSSLKAQALKQTAEAEALRSDLDQMKGDVQNYQNLAARLVDAENLLNQSQATLKESQDQAQEQAKQLAQLQKERQDQSAQLAQAQEALQLEQSKHASAQSALQSQLEQHVEALKIAQAESTRIHSALEKFQASVQHFVLEVAPHLTPVSPAQVPSITPPSVDHTVAPAATEAPAKEPATTEAPAKEPDATSAATEVPAKEPAATSAATEAPAKAPAATHPTPIATLHSVAAQVASAAKQNSAPAPTPAPAVVDAEIVEEPPHHTLHSPSPTVRLRRPVQQKPGEAHPQGVHNLSTLSAIESQLQREISSLGSSTQNPNTSREGLMGVFKRRH